MTTETSPDLSSPRVCPRCNGAGKYTSAFKGEGERTCHPCKGKGNFPGLDVDGIINEIFTKPNKDGKRRFRKSYTSNGSFKDVHKARAYFVWRLTRFHGGADVTMPFTAGLVVDGDPFKPELNAMADMLAKQVFGTDMAAAFRWGQAMGYVQSAPDGLPASAYSGGPVADENKPDFEFIELK